jgi:hypothetical protein
LGRLDGSLRRHDSTRVDVAAGVVEALSSLDLHFLEVGNQKLKELAAAKQAFLGDKK